MNKSKSSLFLMEMIVVIFFFSLAVSVCLEVFIKAHVTATETKELNQAVRLGENAGELFYEYGADFAEKSDAIIGEVADNYRVDLNCYNDGTFLYLDFDYVYIPEERTIYTLSFKQHIKEVPDNE